MPTLVPASPSWPESRLAATAPTVALSGSDALTKTCAAASRPVARTSSRGTISSTPGALTAQACRTKSADAPRAREVPYVSRESRTLVPLADHRPQVAADRAVLLHLPGHARAGQGLGAGRARRRLERRRRRWRRWSRASSRRLLRAAPACAGASRGRARRSPRCAACRCAAPHGGAPSRCARTSPARCPTARPPDRRQRVR